MTAMRMVGDNAGRSAVEATNTRQPRQGGADDPFVMLHVGKIGGSVVKDLIARDHGLDGRRKILVKGHRFTLPMVEHEFPDARFVFFVRDPVERAVSGFLSRYRKGQPRYFREWTPEEMSVFERFPTPDDLGRGLERGDPKAHAAAQDIKHVRRGLRHYLESAETLRRLADKIAFIGAQESLDQDVGRLVRLTGLNPSLSLATDPVSRHEAPVRADFRLSAEARNGFERYLTDDMPIYAEALDMRKRLIGKQAA